MEGRALARPRECVESASRVRREWVDLHPVRYARPNLDGFKPSRFEATLREGWRGWCLRPRQLPRTSSEATALLYSCSLSDFAPVLISTALSRQDVRRLCATGREAGVSARGNCPESPARPRRYYTAALYRI